MDWVKEAKGTLQKLGRIFPVIFAPRKRMPLTLDIHLDIAEQTNFSPEAISSALRWWTNHGRYLEAVAAGTYRHDLHGEPVALIKEGHKRLPGRS